METPELIELLKGEKATFEEMSDISEVILYGSALTEKEIENDIDLLIVPSREMSEGEKVDLRQSVWELVRERLPVQLDVQTPKAGLDKDALSANGVQMISIFSR